MILLYDTSAAGKPKSFKAPATDPFNWPRLIHIAWLEYDAEGNLTEEHDRLIKPEGFDMTEQMERFHHVKHAELLENGEPLVDVLNDFKEAIDRSKTIFTFNQAYNENIVSSEFYRKGIRHSMELTERFDIMREATYFCKIPSKTGGYKWPSLQELHQIIFGASFQGANNAKIDLVALTKCFNHLWSNGHLDDLF